MASLTELPSLAPMGGIGSAPFPTFSTDTVDISGVGPGSQTVDCSAGVYVASVYGGTTKLNVTMQPLDGRSTMTWGRAPFASLAVGVHVEASLYPGRTLRG